MPGPITVTVFHPLRWLFIGLVFINFAVHPIEAKQNNPVKTTGGTYFTNDGGNLDKLTERTPTVDGIIEFSIEVDKALPQQSATLSINAYDVDEERGETNKVYFNDNYIGNLSGTDNSWNTTIFKINPSWVKDGANRIKVVITDSSPKGTIKWSSKVDWGQLLADGGSADQGRIDGQFVKFDNGDNQKLITAKEVEITAVTDVYALVEGEFRLETTMLDKNGNAVVSTTLNKKMAKDQLLALHPKLKYNKSIPSGTYTLVTSLFFKLRDMQIQQSIKETSFEHIENIGKTDPDIVLKRSLSNINVDEDSLPVKIDLGDLYTDENIDRLKKTRKTINPVPGESQVKILLSVKNNNNPNLLTTKIEGNQLDLTFLPDQYGEAVITIRGVLKSKHLDESFKVFVKPVGDSPVIAHPLSDVIVDEDSLSTMIELKDVFHDVDLSGPALPISTDIMSKPDIRKVNLASPKHVETSVFTNNNESLLTAEIKNNTLILNYQKDQSGTAELFIRGTSEGETVDSRLLVTVNAMDDPPQVINEISDINVVENAGPMTIDIKKVFFDIDGIPRKEEESSTESKENISTIIKSILSNSDPELTRVQLKNDQITIKFQPGRWGTSVITLRGVSDDKSVEDSFNVIVSKVGAPVVANPIKDIEVKEDPPEMIIDLSSVFAAPKIELDGSNSKKAQLTKDRVFQTSLESHSNPLLVSAEIKQNKLHLSFAKDQSGVAVLKIRGTSSGKYSDDIFEIRVKPVDDPPVVSHTVPKIEVDEDSDEKVIDLGNLFTDIDNDDSLISQKIVTDNFEDLLTANLNGNSLLLNFKKDRFGDLAIILQGSSNQKTVETKIDISVNPVDDPPTAQETIEDIVVPAGTDSRELNLKSVFTDVDNADISILKTVKSNSNPDLVSTGISGDVLTIVFKKDQTGSATIELMGEVNGAEATTSFSVLVNPKPLYLYGYLMAGSRQVSGYTSALTTTLGVGITLDRYINQLSAELEYSTSLSKHTSQNTQSGVGYETELEITTFGLFLTYPVYTIDLGETQWLPFDSIEFKAKAGPTMRTEHIVSTPNNGSLGYKKPDVNTELVDISFGTNIIFPLMESSGAAIDILFISKDIWSLNLGYRYFF